MSAGMALQHSAPLPSPPSPSLLVRSDSRNTRTEDKTPSRLSWFIGCCWSCFMHIRETLGCQRCLYRRRTDVFASPRFLLKGLVMKAAAWGAFTFSLSYSTRRLVTAADRKTRAAGIVGESASPVLLQTVAPPTENGLNVQSGGGITLRTLLFCRKTEQMKRKFEAASRALAYLRTAAGRNC